MAKNILDAFNCAEINNQLQVLHCCLVKLSKYSAEIKDDDFYTEYLERQKRIIENILRGLYN